jgi:dihydrofolate synthase/folylpolyglutamate synthase
VTQFELLTAAAFVAFVEARVEYAVIEAGLGGRLDATNVIPSKLTVLTSVGLDHTDWLGETEVEIAAEKLAVLRDHSKLALGRVGPDVRVLAEEVAAERAARVTIAPEDPGERVRLRTPGPFQRRNFSLARTAAEAFLGELDDERVEAVAAGLTIPGRLERVGEDPPSFIDAAHNPDGAAALAEALPEIAAGGTVVACLAILGDKDADSIVGALAPAVDRFVCSEPPAAALERRGIPGTVAHPAAVLARLCADAGVEAEAEPRFDLAVERGRELAASRPGGILLVTGSHYVLSAAREVLVS